MSENTSRFDLRNVVGSFAFDGAYVDAVPYGNGHINDTFLVTVRGGRRDRYILQRVNHHVFRKPDELMVNIKRVTDHTRLAAAAAGRDPDRNSLTLLPTADGGHRLVDADGNTWRLYIFIERSIGYDLVDSPAKAYEGGKAFGEFQAMLVDLPGGPLHETIPRFHDMEMRLESFRAALRADRVGRAPSAVDEVRFAEERAEAMSLFCVLGRDGKLPVRTTHNDTKFNNVLLDEVTDEAVCVIDLDTVMPGYVLYDFGDSIRTATNTGMEDDADLERVGVDIALFREYARGYLRSAAPFLRPIEVDHLAFSARVMTFIIGLRFLTDYLDGDRYFKVKHAAHNLQRARAQFRLLSTMEARAGQMDDIVHQLHRDAATHVR